MPVVKMGSGAQTQAKQRWGGRPLWLSNLVYVLVLSAEWGERKWPSAHTNLLLQSTYLRSFFVLFRWSFGALSKNHRKAQCIVRQSLHTFSHSITKWLYVSLVEKYLYKYLCLTLKQLFYVSHRHSGAWCGGDQKQSSKHQMNSVQL